MNKRSRVSNGLPVFNREPYLRETLDSLLSQTYTDFELILSDNGSTDRTEAICRANAARDTRIRCFDPESLGAGPNLERVLDLARGHYFRWPTHVDLQESSLLRKCVEAMDRDPVAAPCHSRFHVIDDNSVTIGYYASDSGDKFGSRSMLSPYSTHDFPTSLRS